MTSIGVWRARHPEGAPQLAGPLLAALRTLPTDRAAWWHVGPLVVAMTDLPRAGDLALEAGPARIDDDLLWLAGEVVAARGPLAHVTAVHSRTVAFRRALLADVIARGSAAIRDLDGEFVAVRWSADGALTVWTDRFGAIPLFHAAWRDGTVLATTVRATLIGPLADTTPDLDAIREAATFGGFRLGDRTNVRAVRRVAAATAVALAPDLTERRQAYWHWRDLPRPTPTSMHEAVEETERLWARAVIRRLDGLIRPGQTLSGGLDSRAILAEAAPRARGWHAVTYGIAGSDDVRLAIKCARISGVTCEAVSLYAGGDPRWLDVRTALVDSTDGLIELGDLMHGEALDAVSGAMDGMLSGYIGDAVVGPTFNEVTTPAQLLDALPYYGGRLGMPHDEALALAARLIASEGGAAPRFALFDHKLPQSTNHAHGSLWRARVRLRRPFLDHDFFDWCQGLDPEWRGARGLQSAWLRRTWPRLFASVPWQKTGVPVGASSARHQAARAARFAARVARRALGAIGVTLPARQRSFTDDARYWRAPGVRERIGAPLRRADALVHSAWDAHTVIGVLDDWERSALAPAQVIGALYVFETYHAGLGATLAACRAATAPPAARITTAHRTPTPDDA